MALLSSAEPYARVHSGHLKWKRKSVSACRLYRTWHRPFCVDLQEATFNLLRQFVERYCSRFDDAAPPSPFPSQS